MNELKMKELYDNCTEEKQKQWDVIIKFHHFQAESKAREETYRDMSLYGCIVIYAETSLHEFI